MENSVPDSHHSQAEQPRLDTTGFGFPLPPNQFFGRRWNAPAFDDAIEIPVPVGAACLYCDELVDDHDSGVMVNALLEDGLVLAPTHIECHLRSMLGPLAHLEKRCSCFGGPPHEPTNRADAKAVMAWVLNQQIASGLPNPGFAD